MEPFWTHVSCNAIVPLDHLKWLTRFVSHKQLQHFGGDRLGSLQNPSVGISPYRNSLQDRVVRDIDSRLNHKCRVSRKVPSVHKASMQLGLLLDEVDLSIDGFHHTVSQNA